MQIAKGTSYMLSAIQNNLVFLKPSTHLGACLLAFAAFAASQSQLDRLYAASRHPVDYATGQLAFDGSEIAGYYDVMRAAGTFGIYVQTQLFDFLFIASVMILGLCLGTLLARIGGKGSWGYALGIWAAGAACLGGAFDGLENLVSFALMSFEGAIPQVLAVIYSSFAALKFTALTCAMALMLASFLAGAVSQAVSLRRRGVQV